MRGRPSRSRCRRAHFRVRASGPSQLGAIGDYERFVAELAQVWKECRRVLVPGGYRSPSPAARALSLMVDPEYVELARSRLLNETRGLFSSGQLQVGQVGEPPLATDADAPPERIQFTLLVSRVRQARGRRVRHSLSRSGAPVQRVSAVGGRLAMPDRPCSPEAEAATGPASSPVD